MDFFNSSYYEHSNYSNLVHDDGQYSLTSYYSPYDHPQFQDSSTLYEYQDFASNPPPFFTDYDHGSSYSTPAYSATSYSEPKYIEFVPAPYYTVQTKFFASYSVAALDDTDFDEYDPTPYRGGYDIVSTYGKPLPPSDKTCYPLSAPNQDSSSLSKESLEKEQVDDSAPKPPVETKPSGVIDEITDKFSEMDHGWQEEIVEKKGADEAGNGYHQVPYVPSGYGLEAMDLCESLFGYWPCLSKITRTTQDCQEFGHSHHCGSYGNPWNGTADYLFGSWDPYSSRDEGIVHGYEKHYQKQNPQVKYVSDPWLG